MASLFEDFPQALESKVFSAYCDMVYGYDLRLDDGLIQEDVDALSAFIAHRGASRILDLGCGSGDLLRYLCHKNSCSGMGLDRHDLSRAWNANPPCLKEEALSGSGLMSRVLSLKSQSGSLLKRAETVLGDADEAKLSDDGGRVQFQRGDMLDPASLEGSYDLVLAVDTLETTGRPGSALDAVLSRIAPGGCCLIAYTERGASKTDPTLAFSWTKMARALKGRGLAIHGRDISKSEKLHWKLSRRILEKTKDDFSAEGLTALHARLSAQTARNSECVEAETLRRYWYCVERA